MVVIAVAGKTLKAASLLIATTAFPLATVVASAAPAGINGATTVPLRGILRTCDFSPIPSGAAQSDATASAVIRATGGAVAAEVHLANPGSLARHPLRRHANPVASAIEFAMRFGGSGRRGWRSG
jgi:hypothetical protein